MQIGFYIDSKIGDSVVALPAIYGIKTLYPKCKLYIFCNPITQNLYSPFEWIDEIILIDENLIPTLNSLHLDFLFSSNSDKNTITYLKTSNAKKLVTYLKPYNLFDFRVKTLFANLITKPQSIKKTLIDLVWLIRPKGARQKPSISTPKLQTFPKNTQTITSFLSNLQIKGKKIIMINPFGYAAKVNLALSEYATLTQKLIEDFFIIIPTFGSKDEEVRGVFPQELLTHQNFCIFHNDDDLLNLVELTSKVNLLISPSTGNIHIADNLGIPSIGIFSFKDTILWGGENMSYVLLSQDREKTINKIIALTHSLA
ncbi:glycosyltransferase family 9 protein [Helicobacter brantae]|uniref:Heptosyltransferase n=1 Tax=Helicobacter brantae TaxID=375927 RepID=A0A3D8J2Y2_9HELI|nr:glycosyltransferase family 9 protein [Helicobacter brantae]RDU71848.1 hypothetical protein CQA58_02050 [Helicobacter brantae]